jgi:protein involved in polysaccharide export with SLBB domain
MSGRSQRLLVFLTISFSLLLVVTITGCTTRSKARNRERAAFIAGQQQALARALQPHDPLVTVIGRVRNPTIPWTEELTVARALIAAGYSGRNPRAILILRNGEQIQIDPAQLLKGEDVALQSGDVVEIRE